MLKGGPRPALVFLSCAPEDGEHRGMLERHLAPLVVEHGLRLWHRGLIEAGKDEDAVAAAMLDTAALILILVSHDYLAAESTLTEMRRAVERSCRGVVVVVPIHLRPCHVAGEPFQHLTGLPANRRPVTLWTDRDEAWAMVAEGIDKALGEPLPGAPSAVASRSGIAGRQPVIVRPEVASPLPTIAHESAALLLLEKLEVARTRRRRLTGAGASTASIDEEIRALKRQLREGGQLQQGDLLGSRYTLLRCLGRGGFATVWEAEDREEHGRVAVKVLHANLAGDIQRRGRFFRGARIMSEIAHRAIVRILEPEASDGGFFYFVMELVPGGDVHRAVLEGRFPSERALALVLQVGDALAQAHDGGYVHRDVKPANILLCADGTPKLTDFDLVAAGDTTGGTRTGALGSFLYAAPESLDRPQEADARADVFGLAMTTVFLLHGGSLPNKAFRHTDAFVDTLGCSPSVKEVLKRALDWEPSERFGDARALCAALEDAHDVKRAVRKTTSALAPSSLATPPTSTIPAHAWVEIGEDSFGSLSSFSVGGVVQRMRRILPGTFFMGSPDTEPGRSSQEGPRHEVVLTRGYWLAETPCTQALWQVVMGENPSRFKDAHRPVERVSWKDCQLFIKKLNALVPGLDVRLPTEAEWEYACRAGTAHATWAGDLDLLGVNNAPVLDAIAWYRGNSGVRFDREDGYNTSGWPEKQYSHNHAGTRRVGQKQANPLGLHDMLGNVSEWCEDSFGAYPAERVTDPLHAEERSGRVYRGGSWDSRAAEIRAAHRLASTSGGRYFDVGLRLARDPAPQRGT